ncbi:MAG: triphosphoribosyl-dephospho-CoA synthase CitG [Clostridia bacterium]|nr:triphosphoribosyl-dephospho-CoA synthase CitG [Clostridia bacterium]
MTQTVDLSQVLEARERRVYRQQALIEQYGLPLVSFSMNIAGPIKNSPLIRRGFLLGKRTLLTQLKLFGIAVIHQEQTDAVTGCEGLFVADAKPERVKRITGAIEDHAPLGRLYDMDVIGADGAKLERPEPRRCLICGQPARECARSRAHSVEELQGATRTMLMTALNDDDAQTAARLATQALLYEVCVTPKPGLVDRWNNGSHRDMDIYSFMSSAAALWPYFETCVKIGRKTAHQPAPQTLSALRWHGVQAECDMLRATGGVNTHKGAVYSMGLLCGALGRLNREQWTEPLAVLTETAAMARGSVERELRGVTDETASTAGQRFFALYGVTGVRGEAEKGFPTVLAYGLPVLEAGLSQGKTPDEAGAAALLALLAHTADTNMIARGGMKRQGEIRAKIEAMLRAAPYPAKETVQQLDEAFMADNLSPGGSADLLSLCWMLHFLREARI